MSGQAAPDGSGHHHMHADHHVPRPPPRDTLLSNDSDDETEDQHSPSTPSRESHEEMRRLTDATRKVCLLVAARSPRDT